ncbi:MAG: ABC transporter ATP-binding protein [Clostridia bacterium]|nr:ABC transporter ATP-binding protein [Clostridia bacterium]
MAINSDRIILETVDVVKQYQQYDTVVTAVNRAKIEVREGSFVSIIGPSGSGKSTFLHICAGLDRPNAGSVVIRGHDITKMKPDQLARFRGEQLGMIFQSHNLLPQFTALENILIPTMLSRKEEISYAEHLSKLVDALGLRDRLNHLPSELSGGQQQRVAIARALINLPQIVFADEPTGNLDRANADEVMELLLRLREEIGMTLVMVTHDETLAAQADVRYKMFDGELSPIMA